MNGKPNGSNGAGKNGKGHATQRSMMSSEERTRAEARVINALVTQRGMPVMDAIRLVARRVVRLDGE
jgi:hypothetical protein